MFLNLQQQDETTANTEFSPVMRCCLAVVITAICIALLVAIIGTEKAAPGLAEQVMAKVDVSGVSNPVTAVLLNFRSYDTLLELAVLLIVAVAMLPTLLTETKTPAKATTEQREQVNPVLLALVKWLVPLAIIIGGYLLWTGAAAPGGAFQAGAMIAGAGVALSLIGRLSISWQSLLCRIALVIGLIVFIGVAIFNAAVTGTTLAFPPQWAGALILIVEIAATVSIAAILLLLFVQLNSIAQSSDEGDAR